MEDSPLLEIADIVRLQGLVDNRASDLKNISKTFRTKKLEHKAVKRTFIELIQILLGYLEEADVTSIFDSLT